ncbi:MAG: hypothetical protein GX557_11550 [Chloroflexi bacterium]|nr:hypothetical protein [Chloroflexota bacterium]
MSPDVQRVLRELTAGSLASVLESVAERLPPEQRQSVMLNSLWDALVGEQLAPGARGWADYLAFKAAVVRLVAALPGCRFVEADS